MFVSVIVIVIAIANIKNHSYAAVLCSSFMQHNVNIDSSWHRIYIVYIETKFFHKVHKPHKHLSFFCKTCGIINIRYTDLLIEYTDSRTQKNSRTQRETQGERDAGRETRRESRREIRFSIICVIFCLIVFKIVSSRRLYIDI